MCPSMCSGMCSCVEWLDHLGNLEDWHICSTERICSRLCGMIFETSKITSVCAIGDIADVFVDALAKSFSFLVEVAGLTSKLSVEFD